MDRKRFKVSRGLASITGAVPTTIIPAESGISPAIVQLAIFNQNGDLRTLRMNIAQEEWFTVAIGGSGTIIWDMGDQEEVPAGSGFNGYISDTLGTAANIKVMARYVRYDDRQPNNLNPATYVPQTIRRPNIQGNQ